LLPKKFIKDIDKAGVKVEGGKSISLRMMASSFESTKDLFSRSMKTNSLGSSLENIGESTKDLFSSSKKSNSRGSSLGNINESTKDLFSSSKKTYFRSGSKKILNSLSTKSIHWD